jgi:ABC-type antimicrobial peptide transport system permease subunit
LKTGIYGVLSYGVVQRRRELGIRLALGGSVANVVRLVLRQGATKVTVGLLVGIGALVSLRHVLASGLYGVTPLDPLVIGVVALVLSLVAFLATVVPASRAARTSPVIAIQR